MTDKLKVWTPFLVSVASVLGALTTILRCAAEEENYQRAIQALAEVAFR